MKKGRGGGKGSADDEVSCRLLYQRIAERIGVERNQKADTGPARTGKKKELLDDFLFRGIRV